MTSPAALERAFDLGRDLGFAEGLAEGMRREGARLSDILARRADHQAPLEQARIEALAEASSRRDAARHIREAA